MYFNPRTPCGVRLSIVSKRNISCNFNPRTPCGVRPMYTTCTNLQAYISIHAPLAGCDTGSRHLLRERYDFNPRTPCGVRRVARTDFVIKLFISIHAPLAGCDHFEILPLAYVVCISIHAPLAGCDGLAQGLILDKKKISIHAPLAGCDSKNTQKIFCIFAITDNKSRKDNVQRRLSERFPYKTGSIYLQK